MTKTLSITKARKELYQLLDNVEKKNHRYIITVNRSPAAALISIADYELLKKSNEDIATNSIHQHDKKAK